ncbi:MAG: CDP-diacylglycerol--serine O-phosphatidyltransferase [Paracoccaceae bacterium]
MIDRQKRRKVPEKLPFLNLLPNIITMLGLFAGLTAIRFVFAERYEAAAGLIILAALLDGLDGQIARRMKATSDIGAELDSLSDFLNFGVAPALLSFQYLLRGAPDIGWIFVLVYVSCCCLRLARFNVMQDAEPDPGVKKSTHFIGVPAPAGALLMLLPAFMSFEGFLDLASIPVVPAVYIALVGAAMVSRLPTFSPKSILVPKDKIVWILIAAAGIVGMMLTRFWLSMILIDLIYAATLVRSAVLLRRTRSSS